LWGFLGKLAEKLMETMGVEKINGRFHYCICKKRIAFWKSASDRVW
jgi:hypothetical protein